MKNIIPSAARTIAIGKYLVALSLSFAKTTNRSDHKATKDMAPPGRRRQLHVLYLLSDLLHHTKRHFESPSASSMLVESLQAYLVDLFGAASAYNSEIYVKQHICIIDLLDIWEGEGYFQSSFIRKLRDTASVASKAGHANEDERTKLLEKDLGEEKKDTPYILPPCHGDPLTPFYDLPAGNLVPHIVPNSARVIKPQLVKALQLAAGPADEKLVVALKEFLKSVESLEAYRFEEPEDGMDVDEMGQSVLGEIIAENFSEGEGYYGWSKAFCKKMKTRGVGFGEVGNLVGRAGRIDRSASPRKRRRYSDSGSSRSRDRTTDKSQSRSSSPNHAPNRRMGQRSSPRPRPPSKEQRRYGSRSHSRSPSYSPPQMIPLFQRPKPPANPQPMQQAQVQRLSPPPSMPFPHPFSQGLALGPGGVPIPPPPPPNYHGPWPPPPPPIPIPNGGNTAPLPVPPAGPKISQNHGAPAFEGAPHSGLQIQAPQYVGGWGQQQLGHVSGYPRGNRGGAQRPFDGKVHNGRGRGFGLGGWTR